MDYIVCMLFRVQWRFRLNTDDHSCPICPNKPDSCCCLYCDTDRAEYGSYDCKECGRAKGNTPMDIKYNGDLD